MFPYLAINLREEWAMGGGTREIMENVIRQSVVLELPVQTAEKQILRRKLQIKKKENRQQGSFSHSYNFSLLFFIFLFFVFPSSPLYCAYNGRGSKVAKATNGEKTRKRKNSRGYGGILTFFSRTKGGGGV